jgi:hypothetical protein
VFSDSCSFYTRAPIEVKPVALEGYSKVRVFGLVLLEI